MGDWTDDIVVSVFCLAYNHGKFIEKTLEGFVSQKTTFRYEVFVHDDASPDNTAEIIRRYAEKYPEIIKPIYQTENQYSKKVGIIKTILFPKTKGKYLAWCEGDDYWCDENKLQRQVEALEAHPECAACFSRVKCVDVEGRFNGVFYPAFERESCVLDGDSFIEYCLYTGRSRLMPFQLSGLMLRKEVYLQYCDDPPEYRKYFDVGDLPLYLYIGLQGGAYYLNNAFSCYRNGNPNSWYGQVSKDVSVFRRHIETESRALIAFDEYTGQKYHQNVMNGVNIRLYKLFKVYEKQHDIKQMQQPEMQPFYNELSWFKKISHHLQYYFPKTTERMKRAVQNYQNRREKRQAKKQA